MDPLGLFDQTFSSKKGFLSSLWSWVERQSLRENLCFSECTLTVLVCSSSITLLRWRCGQHHPRACGAIVDLHVNTYRTMRSQTGGQQFRSRLLSSPQGRTQYEEPLPPGNLALRLSGSQRARGRGGPGRRWVKMGIGVTRSAFKAVRTPRLRRTQGETEAERHGAPGTDLISR